MKTTLEWRGPTFQDLRDEWETFDLPTAILAFDHAAINAVSIAQRASIGAPVETDPPVPASIVGATATQTAIYAALIREKLRREGEALPPEPPSPGVAAAVVREAIYSLYADFEEWPARIDAVSDRLSAEWGLAIDDAFGWENAGAFWAHSGIEARLVNVPGRDLRQWRPSLEDFPTEVERFKRDILASLAQRFAREHS